MTNRRDWIFETIKPKTSSRAGSNSNQVKSSISSRTYDAAQKGYGIANNRHSHNHQHQYRFGNNQINDLTYPSYALIKNRDNLVENCLQGLYSPLTTHNSLQEAHAETDERHRNHAEDQQRLTDNDLDNAANPLNRLSENGTDSRQNCFHSISYSFHTFLTSSFT